MNMESSLQNSAPHDSKNPLRERSLLTVNITLPKALKEESETALKALIAETGVPMPFKSWVVRVYAATWKVEIEKFRKKVSL